MMSQTTAPECVTYIAKTWNQSFHQDTNTLGWWKQWDDHIVTKARNKQNKTKQNKTKQNKMSTWSEVEWNMTAYSTVSTYHGSRGSESSYGTYRIYCLPQRHFLMFWLHPSYYAIISPLWKNELVSDYHVFLCCNV